MGGSGFCRGGRPWSAGIVAGLALFAGAAAATEVTVPKTDPQIAITIPEGWTVEYDDIGVEIRSPEKDSIILATVLKRERTEVDAWTRKVLNQMMTTGVTVDATASALSAKTSPDAGPKAPAAGASTLAAQGAKVPSVSQAPPPSGAPALPEAASVPPPDASVVSAAPALPGTSATPSFAFAGNPSLDTPKLVGGAPTPPTSTLPTSAPPAGHKVAPTINGLHFQVVRYFGAKFKDKPTDIQLALFALPKNEFFAIEQQSLPEDNRAVAIISSVRPLTP